MYRVERADVAWVRCYSFSDVERAVTQACGEIVRWTREDRGYSPTQLVARMRRRVGDSALLSWEKGTRHLTVIRLLDVCISLELSMPGLMEHVLSRARLILLDTVGPPNRITFGEEANEVDSHSGEAVGPIEMAVGDDELPMRVALGRHSVTAYTLLEDEVARLRLTVAEERTRREAAEKRADMAESHANAIHTAVADANTRHRAASADVARAHEQELADLRGEHRRVIADLHTRNAAHVERLIRDLVLPPGVTLLLGNDPTATVSVPAAGGPADHRKSPAATDRNAAVGKSVAAVVAALRGELVDLAPGMAPLTDRENAVMLAAATGMDVDEIAAELDVSSRTVHTVVKRVNGKVKVRNRAAAIAACLALGLVDVLALGPRLFPDLVDDNGVVDLAMVRTRLMPLARSTERDRLVLLFLARGDDNPMIADQLKLPVHAVKYNVRRVQDSIRARNRFHIVGILHFLAAITPAPAPDTATVAGGAPGAADAADAEASSIEPVSSPADAPTPVGAHRRVLTLPAQDVASWQQYARELVVLPTADPALVAIYDTLVEHQKLTLKALAIGTSSWQVANVLHVSLEVVDRHIKSLCRRFKVDDEFGLAALGRDLLFEGNTEK